MQEEPLVAGELIVNVDSSTPERVEMESGDRCVRAAYGYRWTEPNLGRQKTGSYVWQSFKDRYPAHVNMLLGMWLGLDALVAPI
eukprot:5467815-Amphidinium_carterae.1